jgi:hypothetical protein
LVVTATGLGGLANGIVNKGATTAATETAEEIVVGTAVREGAAEVAAAKAAPVVAEEAAAVGAEAEILAPKTAPFVERVITPAVSDLSPGVVQTFTGGNVTASVTQTEITLYRVYGEQAGRVGSCLTRTKPTSAAQAMKDLALDPAWGNSRAFVAEVKVPAGTPIYEGTAAAQGSLAGGGNQVYILPREWLRAQMFVNPGPFK